MTLWSKLRGSSKFWFLVRLYWLKIDQCWQCVQHPLQQTPTWACISKEEQGNYLHILCFCFEQNWDYINNSTWTVVSIIINKKPTVDCFASKLKKKTWFPYTSDNPLHIFGGMPRKNHLAFRLSVRAPEVRHPEMFWRALIKIGWWPSRQEKLDVSPRLGNCLHSSHSTEVKDTLLWRPIRVTMFHCGNSCRKCSW